MLKAIETIFEDLEFTLNKISVESYPVRNYLAFDQMKNNVKVSTDYNIVRKSSNKYNKGSNDTSLDSNPPRRIY